MSYSDRKAAEQYNGLAEDKIPIVQAIIAEVEKGKTIEERMRIFAKAYNDFYPKLDAAAISWMRHSALSAKVLYDLNIDPALDPGANAQGVFDSSTPGLVAAMLSPHYIRPGDTVITLGPGPFAVEACILNREKGICPFALDINPAYIESGKSTAKANNARVIFIHSDIFKPFPGQAPLPRVVNWITWNVPYVTTREVEEKGLQRFPSDGGPTGLDVMARALKELPVRYRTAGLIFVINTRRHSEETIRRLVEENGFAVLEVFSLPGSPSKAFIMQYGRGPRIQSAAAVSPSSLLMTVPVPPQLRNTLEGV